MAAGQTTADLHAAGGESQGEESGLAAEKEQEKEKLTVTEILRVGAPQVADSSCPQVQSVLAKLSLCRTHVLGGRKFQCNDCGETSSRYNSCGDRHCPGCSGSKRVDFNDKASKLILPGVVYYQVVFTLPSDLSELALANREELADLLSSSAWKCLSANIKGEQDYDPAAVSVLHTWNQKLEAHWHVHLLVPGEGPSLSTGGWKQATAPPEVRNSDGYYLVDAQRLKVSFRKKSIARLRRLHRDGKLKLGGKFEYLRSEENWDAFVKNLESQNWVAYIQPPPKETSEGSEVVNYQTRYLTGGPIGNHRIVDADCDEVTFLARENKRVGGEREQVPITLAVAEFVRRWSLHIQPDQLTKSRYFGGWSNTRLAVYMKRCRDLLESLGRLAGDEQLEEPQPHEVTEVIEPTIDDTIPKCPHCGSIELELLSERAKPSWKELFWRESETCPEWYAESQRASHRAFWTAAYGSDFYAL